MARNFKIFMHQAIDELLIGLKGDFDGSSALELIHMLKQNVNRYGRILIDTHNLKKIYPFGRDVFNYNFIKLKDHRSRIHFIGPDDLQTGQIDFIPNEVSAVADRIPPRESSEGAENGHQYG